MCVSVCGRFGSGEGGVVGCADGIKRTIGKWLMLIYGKVLALSDQLTKRISLL